MGQHTDPVCSVSFVTPDLLIVMLVSSLVSAVATRGVLQYAKSRLLDHPNERSSHATPTPRGGGLGLVIGWAAGSAVAIAGGGGWPGALVAAAVGAMSALGWADDHWHLSARIRLAIQLALVVVLVLAIGIPDHVVLAGLSLPGPVWVLLPIATFGLAWLVNLTNFMDGIDGIAGAQGVVGCICLAVILQATGIPAWNPLMLLAGAGACCGFLVWNWPPARIFMGDVGSTSLGFLFASGVMAGAAAGVDLLILLLPLGPFVLDATCTLFRRAWRRERLSEAHRSHLYQRLARQWGSHRPVTVLYALLAVGGGGGAILAQRHVVPVLVPGVVLAILFTGLALYGRRRCPA